jgi:hypothetical protein
MAVLSKRRFKYQIAIKNKSPDYLARAFYQISRANYIGAFLLVSLLPVSVFMVVSVLLLVLSVVTAGVTVAVESVFVLSEPSVDFVELQPAAIEPTIVATNAKLKMCFFIGYKFIVMLKKIRSGYKPLNSKVV